MKKIGKVVKINRYPVKSFAGESPKRVFVSYSGIVGDRAYALVRKGDDSTFPWLSARIKHELILLQPKYKKDLFTKIGINLFYHDKKCYDLDVTTPDGKTFNINDSEFADYMNEFAGEEVEIKFSERGLQDSRPVSILGIQSLEGLEEDLGKEVEQERFRMNFLVDWFNNRPFSEDELLKKTIKIGEKLELQVNKKDVRCVITTLNPFTAEKDPEILKTIATKYKNCFGVYAAVLREGIVKRNDPIFLIE